MDTKSHPIFALAIGLNVVWYTMKVLLRRRGFEVHWIHSHFADWGNMLRLIKITPGGAERALYIALLSLVILGTLAFVAAAAHLLLGVRS